MSTYLKDNDFLWPTDENTYDVKKSLPVGTYTVGHHHVKGFYLKVIDDFKTSGKIYGKADQRAQRIINTFQSRPSSTGVLLEGEKGSGKTMLAKLISEKAMRDGVSTIVINTPFTGDSFNSFIQGINEPCIIVFDEFEKVFDEKEQEATLTLLDGVYPSKKMFMLTVNNKYRVNMHMCNRPGRIFYMIEFKGIDESFIREYCEDNLDNKQYIDHICRLVNLFDSFNFDMLKALVEEMNRYNESPSDALTMLNAKPLVDSRIKYRVSVVSSKKTVNEFYPEVFIGNPLASGDDQPVTIFLVDPAGGSSKSVAKHTSVHEVAVSSDSSNHDNGNWITVNLDPHDITELDIKRGVFTYVANRGTSNECTITLSREASARTFNWLDVV